MKILILPVLTIAMVISAQTKQTFTGVITDSMCANADHASMRMGPTNAECTVACVMVHDASYVLFDGQHAYVLSDQKTPEKFAGQKVKVVGTLDAKSHHTIKMESIAAAK